MNKKIIILIIITAVISSLITYTFTKKSIQVDKLNIIQILKKYDNSITLIPTEKPNPKYSVSILDTPITTGIFSLRMEIKNISITPYMTGIYLRECEFIDEKENKHKGSLDSPVGGYGIENKFLKAILPNESQVIDFNNLNIDVLGGGGVDRSGKAKVRCQYDNKGDKICSPIEGLKIEKCMAYTSTSSDYRGDFPLEVDFPK